MQLGSVKIDNPIILAPLSGITDMPFRRLVKKLGAGLVVSEMIASNAMIRQTRESLKKAQRSQEEDLTAVQLAGHDPYIMAEAAKMNEDMGAQIIDINFGCPVKKIVNGYAGSALMKDEKKAAAILEQTVKAVNLPVTLKMRLGWDDENRNAPQLAKIAEDLGIKMITVHGRTRCQMFKGKANWKAIREVKESVSIPVIANGDINNFSDIHQALEESQADGIMIGRGICGKPWFINQATHFLQTGKILPEPSQEERLAIILEHYDHIIEHYTNRQGVGFARKHLSWYSAGFYGSNDFRRKINTERNYKIVKDIIEEFFSNNTSEVANT